MALLSTKKVLCLFDVDLKAPPPPACVAKLPVAYRLVDKHTWATHPYTSDLPDRHLFPSRLERGEQFWTAQQEGKILSYCWATRLAVEIGEIRRKISPRDDEVYFYDAFTFATYRGYNLYPALLQHMLEQSRQQGFRRALIFVMSDNIASIRGVSKAGFREFQRVIHSRIFGITRYGYQPPLSGLAGVNLLPA